MRDIFFKIIFISIFISGSIFYFQDNLYAESYSFKSMMDKAIGYSIELEKSKLDILIGETIVQEKRGAYYPSLQLRYNTEYVKDLTNGLGSAASIGDSVLNSVTKYQNSLSLQLSYTLIDFENRKHQVDIANRDIDLKKYERCRIKKDTQINVLQKFTEGLLFQFQLAEKQSLMPLNTELFIIMERLYQSGKISKIDVSDAAINVARVASEITNLSMRISEVFSHLSIMTGENYDFQHSKFTQLSEVKIDNRVPDYYLSPEYKILTMELEKKRLESIIVQRSILPKINFYSKFNMYGSDKYAFNEAIYDVSEHDVSVGISIIMPIYEGGIYMHQRKRVNLEKQKIYIERVRKYHDMEKYYESISDKSQFTSVLLREQNKLLSEIENKVKMLDRMTVEKLIDKQSYLQQKSEIITQKYEVLESITKKLTVLWEMKFIMEASDSCKQD